MHQPIVAYFSAEYSVADSLPIYAGGLGILAGDTVQEAGQEGRDFHAVGMVYHEAFTPGDDDTRPIVARLSAEGFDIVAGADGQPLEIMVPIEGDQIKIRAWRKNYGPAASLILLDTKLDSNSVSAQQITDHLYDGAPGVMLRQQLVLGLGGVAFLEALGVKPEIYHLNEGHMAFVGLAVALQYQRQHSAVTLAAAFAAVKPMIASTKHTILPGAGLTLERATLELVLGQTLAAAKGSVDDLMALGGKPDGSFSTTKFVLAVASRHSGVSQIHVKAEAEKHPGSQLVAITNGVYAPRWRAASLDGEPLKFTDENLWQAHNLNRQQLLAYAEAETGQKLHADHLTVVWARRMTAYKRPELLVNDLKRLTELARHADQPVQFIVAGKANPVDGTGIGLMNKVIAASELPELAGSLAYLPHYNPMTARLLVQGADLWLNTPIRGQEACGTSGMKASLNGALQFSTSDGWIDEVDAASIGWVLPVEGAETAIYKILEDEIAPLFYDRADGLPTQWIAKMRANIDVVEKKFTSIRMLDEYYDKLYK